MSEYEKDVADGNFEGTMGGRRRFHEDDKEKCDLFKKRGKGDFFPCKSRTRSCAWSTFEREWKEKSNVVWSASPGWASSLGMKWRLPDGRSHVNIRLEALSARDRPYPETTLMAHSEFN